VLPLRWRGTTRAVAFTKGDGLNLGRLTRARQWLLPVDPRSYRKVASRMIRRTDATAIGPSAPALVPESVAPQPAAQA
jgi:hypothetical protein